MSDVFVFVDINKHFRMTVKLEFLDICSTPWLLDLSILSDKFHYYEFLHNTNGPAMQALLPGKEKTTMYVINGKWISDPDIINQIKSGTYGKVG